MYGTGLSLCALPVCRLQQENFAMTQALPKPCKRAYTWTAFSMRLLTSFSFDRQSCEAHRASYLTVERRDIYSV